MAKHILSDIRPLSRKPRATPAKVEEPVAPKRRTIRASEPLPREIPFTPSGPKYSSRFALWWIAGACIIGFLFSISFLFEHATVVITPKQIPLAFDDTDSFVAQKDATDASAISYTVMKLSGDESIKIPGTPSASDSIAARGLVVLYNALTTAPYKLIKSTRLSTSDGRVYRISKAVSIPGYTMSGSTVVPGSVEVEAVADVPGAAGNLDTSDLTLPAFAGKPQYSKIYGRTKTAMKGGASGASYTVSADAAQLAVSTLKTKLQASLIAKAKVQVPDGYLFYQGATLFTSDDSPQTPSSTTSDVPVGLSGTLYAYLIKQDTLVNAIAQKYASQYQGEPVSVPKLSALTLAPATTIQPTTEDSFTFTLAGNGNLVWSIDQDAFKKIIAGQKKSSFDSILSSMTSIDKADMVIKPFWKRSFPSDTKRIAVTVLDVK